MFPFPGTLRVFTSKIDLSAAPTLHRGCCMIGRVQGRNIKSKKPMSDKWMSLHHSHIYSVKPKQTTLFSGETPTGIQNRELYRRYTVCAHHRHKYCQLKHLQKQCPSMLLVYSLFHLSNRFGTYSKWMKFYQVYEFWYSAICNSSIFSSEKKDLFKPELILITG